MGQRLLRYASLDDIAIWAVLALVLLDWQRVGRQLLFLIAFAVVGSLCRRLMVRTAAADRWYLGLIWLAACGFGADWSGLHFMVGAFLAGVVMEARWFDQKQLDLLRNHLLLVVMPVSSSAPGCAPNGASAVRRFSSPPAGCSSPRSSAS